MRGKLPKAQPYLHTQLLERVVSTMHYLHGLVYKRITVGLPNTGTISNIGFGNNSTAVGPNSRIEQSIPTFAQPLNKEGCTNIKNREYLGDILSSTGFSLQVSATLNPGLGEYFPWLANVAKNYTQYRFNSLIFMYKSTSGALSTTQALGQVMGSTSYNVYDPVPASKSAMLNQPFASSKVPSEDCLWPVECAPSMTSQQGLLYVRGGGITQGDQRMYDLGIFHLATNGQAEADLRIGELWVIYDIDLFKPELPVTNIAATNLSIISNTAYTNAAPLGSGTQTVTKNDLGLTVSGTKITFPELASGTFLLDFHWVGSATSGMTGYGNQEPIMSDNISMFITDVYNWHYAPATGQLSSRVCLSYMINILPSTAESTLEMNFTFPWKLPNSGQYFTLRVVRI